MTGRVNTRGFFKLGDGIFSMNSFDAASDIEVMFPSKRYGPNEFEEFIQEPVCTEGHPEQRMRIVVDHLADVLNDKEH